MKTSKPLPLLMLIFILLPFLAGNVSASDSEKPRKCIMVFGAHADDVEILAGGTFARYIAEGYEGIYVCVINNTAGCATEAVGGGTKFRGGEGIRFSISESGQTFPVGALETIQVRQEEARKAAGVFNAIPVFLDFSQPEIYLGRTKIIYGTKEFIDFDPPGRKHISLATRYSEDVGVVTDLLKKYEPEIVITHTLGGEKLDHEGTAYMVYLAFISAMRENAQVGKLWMTVNGWLLDKEARESGRGIPDVSIDISDYLDVKYMALDQHTSQNGGFGRDYIVINKGKINEDIEEFITVVDNSK